ncbi:MAG: GNAT family N-acetyltransferase [Oscillospiraceae bacterium]|nr:GNAT family N-acetyltransferase [Oscillospiraceae bacterium]
MGYINQNELSEIVYGTSNPAKLEFMRRLFDSFGGNLGISIVGLTDISCDIPVPDETGNDPLRNARIKALSYYRVLKRLVFSCDTGLYIDDLDDDKQPGVHVRLVDGKRLSDDEMITYYSGLAAAAGGKVTARYINAICLVINEHEMHEQMSLGISPEPFYIVETPHSRRKEGFPLDSLSVSIADNRYFYDLEKYTEDIGYSVGFVRFFAKVKLSFELEIVKYEPKHRGSILRLFHDTVHSVNSKDYTQAQLNAWAPDDINESLVERWLERNDLFLVAVQREKIVGFGAANLFGYFDLLYVHKDYLRIGIATAIANHIEKYMYDIQITTVTASASLTSKPFFEQRGYTVIGKQKKEFNGCSFINFNMIKDLSDDYDRSVGKQ